MEECFFLCFISSFCKINDFYDTSLVYFEPGIFDLGCIGECTGLVILDLSNNKISSVNLLGRFKKTF